MNQSINISLLVSAVILCVGCSDPSGCIIKELNDAAEGSQTSFASLVESDVENIDLHLFNIVSKIDDADWDLEQSFTAIEVVNERIKHYPSRVNVSGLCNFISVEANAQQKIEPGGLSSIEHALMLTGGHRDISDLSRALAEHFFSRGDLLASIAMLNNGDVIPSDVIVDGIVNNSSLTDQEYSATLHLLFNISREQSPEAAAELARRLLDAKDHDLKQDVQSFLVTVTESKALRP